VLERAEIDRFFIDQADIPNGGASKRSSKSSGLRRSIPSRGLQWKGQKFPVAVTRGGDSVWGDGLNRSMDIVYFAIESAKM